MPQVGVPISKWQGGLGKGSVSHWFPGGGLIAGWLDHGNGPGPCEILGLLVVALLALRNVAGDNALDLARARHKRQAVAWLEAQIVEHLREALPAAYGGGRRWRGAMVLRLAHQLTPPGAAGPERSPHDRERRGLEGL